MIRRFAQHLLCLLIILLELSCPPNARPPAVHAALNRDVLNHALLSTVLILTLDNNQQVIASGSGSIVDPRGIILTNFHVVGDTQSGRLTNRQGVVGILMTDNPRQQAVPMFYAQFIEGDPNLDLALVKVVAHIDGTDMTECLNLPSYEIGDSDAIQIGDELGTIGFPGLGGSSVTFTTGTVSGFESDRSGNVVWMKTDAEINPGNSGGSAIASDGTLVGVPSAGKIDPQSAGKIGLVRPINFAVEWLQNLPSVEIPGCSATSSTNPRTNPAPGTNPPPPPSPGKQPGDGGSTRPNAQKRVSGVILSADSGEPIADALFVILTPGITWNSVDLKNRQHIHEVVFTDHQGRFETEQAVDLATPYSVGAGADGYQDVQEDEITFSQFDDGAATVELEISLKRQ